MSVAEFFGALVAVIVAGTGSTVALAVYLGARVDRLAEQVAQLRTDMALHENDREVHA